MRKVHLGAHSLALCLVLALAGTGVALGEESEEGALNAIVELNKKALTLYDALEMEAAADVLKQALDQCAQGKLDDHPTAARTHLHLGVVYLSGLKKRDLGLAEFRKALAIDPKIRVTKSLINPEVQSAFSEAQAGPETHAKSAPFPIPNKDEGDNTSPTSGDKGLPILYAPIITKAPQNHSVTIKAQVPPGLGAARVVLAYQADNAPEFLVREMPPTADNPGWYQAEIPAEATLGLQVAYYVEAQDSDDRAMATSGSHEDPHVIVLLREPSAGDQGSDDASRAMVGAARSAKPMPAGIWLVLAGGTGAGYHAGSPEMNPTDGGAPARDLRVSGLGYARLLHAAPEIGVFVAPHIVVSAQGRFQYVTGNQDVRIGAKTYDKASLALAGLAKLRWLPRQVPSRWQPILTIAAGAGQIRHVVETPSEARLSGCGDKSTTCRDTVLGGLYLVGLGAGTLFRLNQTFALYASIDAIAAFPHVMLQADLNLGLAITR